MKLRHQRVSNRIVWQADCLIHRAKTKIIYFFALEPLKTRE